MRTEKIGAHIFYRFPRGAEWSKIRGAVERKRAKFALRRQVIASRERAARLNREAANDGYVTVAPSQSLKVIKTASQADELNRTQYAGARAPAP